MGSLLQWYEMQTCVLTRTWVCLCAFEQAGEENRLDRDNLETETLLAQVLWVTSWLQPVENQWGLGRPPVCFQGNRALSPPPPHKTSHSLSPSLSMSLSLSLLHAPMFFLGGVEEEGDDEVTHCNIIAMAMKSEPREEGERREGRKRMGISIGGGEMEMAVTISVLKLKMEISVWYTSSPLSYSCSISLKKKKVTFLPSPACPRHSQHRFIPSFFSFFFTSALFPPLLLCPSSPAFYISPLCFLFPLLLACCAQPPALQGVYFPLVYYAESCRARV